jgi:hypothetical protein
MRRHSVAFRSRCVQTCILMSMRIALAVLVLLAAGAALAHPAVNVVIDARGNVYYSKRLLRRLRERRGEARDANRAGVDGREIHAPVVTDRRRVRGGDLWLLENSATNQVRVRKVRIGAGR